MTAERRVVYYAGCAASYYETEIAKSTIRVLEKNGFTPVLPEQKCCGIPHLSGGDAKSFRRLAEYNVASLAEADADVVTACSSCVLALKQEYPRLVGTPEARALAARSYDIIEYLLLLRERGALNRSFRPLLERVLYHTPCHLRVLAGDAIDRRLEVLREVPGISLDSIDRGCCGMGGAFGIKASTYSVSMAIGTPLFEGIRECAPSRVATECPACSWQIHHGTGSGVTHPVCILAEAYDS